MKEFSREKYDEKRRDRCDPREDGNTNAPRHTVKSLCPRCGHARQRKEHPASKPCKNAREHADCRDTP